MPHSLEVVVGIEREGGRKKERNRPGFQTWAKIWNLDRGWPSWIVNAIQLGLSLLARCVCVCVCAFVPTHVLDYCTLMLRMTPFLSSLRLPSPVSGTPHPNFLSCPQRIRDKRGVPVSLDTHQISGGRCSLKKWEQECGWERAIFSSQWFTAS